MGRRNKSYLCGPSVESVIISRVSAFIGFCVLILLYYLFRKDSSFRNYYWSNPEAMTETEKQSIIFNEKQSQLYELTRSSFDIKTINIIPIGKSDSQNLGGFYEISKRSVDQALEEYKEVPSVMKNNSVFFFHSFDMMEEHHNQNIKEYKSQIFDASVVLTNTIDINNEQVYDEIKSTEMTDLLSSILKVRQFIEGVIHVRLSVEAAENEAYSVKRRRQPYANINKQIRMKKLLGAKIHLNIFVTDIHIELYQSVLRFVMNLAPSLDNYIAYSFEKVSSEKIKWSNEESFREIVQRTEKAHEELERIQRIVVSMNDANALSVIGGRKRLKYL